MPSGAPLAVSNVLGHSASGSRSLAIQVTDFAAGDTARVTTPTFAPLSTRDLRTYDLLGSPDVVPRADRQRAGRGGSREPGTGRRRPPAASRDRRRHGRAIATDPSRRSNPAGRATLDWRVPDLGGQPILDIGLELTTVEGAPIAIRWQARDGLPRSTRLDRTAGGAPRSSRRRRGSPGGTPGWMPSTVSTPAAPMSYRVIQNRGTGLLMQGTEEWHDLTVEAGVRIHIARAGGIAVHARGLTRWVALLLDMTGRATLVRSQFDREVLAEAVARHRCHARPITFALMRSAIASARPSTACRSVRCSRRPVRRGGRRRRPGVRGRSDRERVWSS